MIDKLNLPGTRSGRYLALVVAPALLVWFYLVVLAADGYVSRAQVMVEQDASSPAAAAGAELALGLLSVGGGRSKQDALLVQNFMLSRTMLEYLDGELGLREHFSRPRVDFVRRLASDASKEDFLEFYRDHLAVTIDESSLIVGVEFTAFDPEFAQEVTRKLVARGEEFVNEVGRQLAREQLRFAQEQVEHANERMKQATRAMIELQRTSDVYSLEKETEAVGQILAGLEVELAKQRTELKALMAYLNPSAPEVIAMRQRVDALASQVAQERGRLVGRQSDGLNELTLDYQDAEMNLRLATEVYKTALAGMESTRLESVRKVKYLVSVDQPSLPDSAELPRVLYWTLTVFVFLNLAYLVITLIIATIEDHRE